MVAVRTQKTHSGPRKRQTSADDFTRRSSVNLMAAVPNGAAPIAAAPVLPGSMGKTTSEPARHHSQHSGQFLNAEKNALQRVRDGETGHVRGSLVAIKQGDEDRDSDGSSSLPPGWLTFGQQDSNPSVDEAVSPSTSPHYRMQASPSKNTSSSSLGGLNSGSHWSNSAINQSMFPDSGRPRASLLANTKMLKRANAVANLARRASACAFEFQIRASMTKEDNHDALAVKSFGVNPRLMKDSMDEDSEDREHWCLEKYKEHRDTLKGWLASPTAARILQMLAVFNTTLAMLFMAAEEYCEAPEEKIRRIMWRRLHTVISIVYALVAFGEMWAVGAFSTFLINIFLWMSSADARSKMAHGVQVTLVTNVDWNIVSLAPRFVRDIITNGKPISWKATVASKWLPVEALVLGSTVMELSMLGHESESPSSYTYIMWLASMCRFWRWMRSDDTPQRVSSVTPKFWIQVLEICISFCLFAHASACVLCLSATYQVANGAEATWAHKDVGMGSLIGRDVHSCYDFYIAGAYFASATVTSIGYGDYAAVNRLEMIICSSIMILGQMFLAQLFADLNFASAMHNFWRSKQFQSLTQTTAALQAIGAPVVLSERVNAFQEFAFEVQRERLAKECLQDLPQLLREELQIVMYHGLIAQAPFLQQISGKALRCIMARMQDRCYLPGDFIICYGQVGHELFFLREGCVGVFLNQRAPVWADMEIRNLHRGDFFGEVALLTGQERSSWVMARSYCACSVLHKAAIDEVMEADPSTVAVLTKSMQDALNMKPKVTWLEVALCMENEFGDEEEAFDYVCQNVNNGGLMSWSKYEMLMGRLGISEIDAKLLWVDLDILGDGSSTWSDFIIMLRRELKEHENSMVPTMPRVAEVEEANASCWSSQSGFARSRQNSMGSGLNIEINVQEPDSPEHRQEVWDRRNRTTLTCSSAPPCINNMFGNRGRLDSNSSVDGDSVPGSPAAPGSPSPMNGARPLLLTSCSFGSDSDMARTLSRGDVEEPMPMRSTSSIPGACSLQEPHSPNKQSMGLALEQQISSWVATAKPGRLGSKEVPPFAAKLNRLSLTSSKTVNGGAIRAMWSNCNGGGSCETLGHVSSMNSKQPNGIRPNARSKHVASNTGSRRNALHVDEHRQRAANRARRRTDYDLKEAVKTDVLEEKVDNLRVTMNRRLSVMDKRIDHVSSLLGAIAKHLGVTPPPPDPALDAAASGEERCASMSPERERRLSRNSHMSLFSQTESEYRLPEEGSFNFGPRTPTLDENEMRLNPTSGGRRTSPVMSRASTEEQLGIKARISVNGEDQPTTPPGSCELAMATSKSASEDESQTEATATEADEESPVAGPRASLAIVNEGHVAGEPAADSHADPRSSAEEGAKEGVHPEHEPGDPVKREKSLDVLT
eukprot:TRINITY_DN23436_c0_g1_i1.p1 TRINITY_DN23436_c0_g1~~TRINITY_DN23436_c0_g1_i1.p1  ORF type:complete len:1397 (-),score=259.74 TRINITY_DN23436_c0_g1_i1:168-4358(-)